MHSVVNDAHPRLAEQVAAATGRRKVVLYNPDAVFFTMPLALIAIGSNLDPKKHEVVIVRVRCKGSPDGGAGAFFVRCR